MATEYKDDSTPGTHSVRIEVPLGAECPSHDYTFVVVKPEKARIPLDLAAHLFSETVATVTSLINPDRRLKVRLFLTLKLGGRSDCVTVRRGEQGSTVIEMRKWNEVLFAEMLARAVAGSILTESELDDAAHLALRRARTRVSVSQLQSQ
ncbi:MAG TPA: hypothetical protein VMG82_39995 [Candidatus Sulfotelmatobacter sp.]|nr:hypothetical protein [Candidatus Sulfotelmatobacter sp.]